MRVYLAALAIMIVPTLCMDAAPAYAAEPTAVGLWEQIDQSSGKADGWFLVSEHDGLYDATLVKIFLTPGENPIDMCGMSGCSKGCPVAGPDDRPGHATGRAE